MKPKEPRSSRLPSEPTRERVLVGSGVLAEEIAGLGSSFTLITQEGPLRNLDGSIRALAGATILATTLEATELERVVETASGDHPIVGVGGGVVMDTAKWVGWSLGAPVFLVPSAVSVDAMVTATVAVRTGGGLQYQGFVVPERIIVDIELVRTAPRDLNRAGIGDLLSIHTGLFDWRLGAAAGGVLFDEQIAAAASSILDGTIEAAAEIADVSERGVTTVMAGYSDINDMCLAAGHSQMQEGSEHYFAYLAEQVTGRHYVHGELITLGMVLMSRWQDNVDAKVVEAVERARVRWRPSDLGLDRRALVEILQRLPEFTSATNLRYSVVNERPLDRCEIASMLDGLV